MSYWCGLKPGLFVLGLISIVFFMNAFTEYFLPRYRQYKDLRDEHNRYQLVSSIRALIALAVLTILLFIGVFI
jgi:hypothetical protein